MRTFKILSICCLLGFVLAQTGIAQWTHVSGPTGDVFYLSVSGTNMFAQSSSGFYYSTNNGLQWSQANPALAESLYTTYAADTVNLLLGAGLTQLPPLPDTVIKLASAGLDMSTLLSLAAGVSILSAGTNFDSILVSLDTGSTAIRVSELMAEYALYAAGLSTFDPLSAFQMAEIYFWSSGGAKWISIYDIVSTITIRALVKTNTYLYVGTDKGIYRTGNNGTVWVQVNNGLSNTNVYALAQLNTMLFAGTAAGVFRSTDGGATWHAYNTGLTNIAVRAIAAAGTNLFVGTNGGGVFVSTDYGANWKAVNEGLTFKTVNALAVNQGNLFAGTSGGGLWKRPLSEMTASLTAVLALSRTSIAFPSTKVGQWKDTTVVVSNTGTDTLKITSIVSGTAYFSARPAKLTIPPGQFRTDTIRFQPVSAGEFRDTLFLNNNSHTNPVRLALSGNGITTGTDQPNNNIPDVYTISQNYPNPFNPSTTLRYGLPARSHVRLQVYNILGQVVADLVNNDQAAGWKEVVWNANVASGLYFYRIEAISSGNSNKRFVDVKKMILLK
jgi:hypothetical protein